MSAIRNLMVGTVGNRVQVSPKYTSHKKSMKVADNKLMNLMLWRKRKMPEIYSRGKKYIM